MIWSDYLQRLVFEDINARCVWVRLDRVIDRVLGQADLPEAVGDLLARALAVVATLSSGIKFTGRISLQLQAPERLGLLLADCTSDGGLRGIVRGLEADRLPGDGEALFTALAREATLTLTLEPEAGQGQRWQGIVPLEGVGLAGAVEQYFERSEQLPTRLRLAVGDGQAVALMVQKMPGQGEDADGWNRLEHLLATLGDEEMLAVDGEALFERLFHQEDRRLFPPRELRFHCPCSRERVVNVLYGLGREELEEAIEAEGWIEVRCEFCNEAYRFDRVDVAAIVESGEDDSSDTVH